MNPSMFEMTPAADSYVLLHRRDETTKRLIYHGRLSLDEASEEHVAKLYGGGYYRAQLRSPGESGAPVIVKTREFALPGPYRPPTSMLPGTQTVTAADAIPRAGMMNSGGDANAILSSALVTQVLDLMKASKEVALRPSGPDLMPLLIAQMQSQMKMMEIMFMRPAAGGDPRAEAMAMFHDVMEMVKGLNPAAVATKPQDLLTDLVGAIKQLRDVADDVNPSRGSDPLMDSLPKLTEIMAEGMRRGREEPNNIQHARAVVSKTPTIDASVTGWRRVLLMQQPRLMQFASTGRDPEFCAEMAVQLMPAEIRGTMMEFVQLPDFIQQAAATAPVLAQYPDWAARFLTEARILLLGLDDEDGEDEGAGEDDADVSGAVVEGDGSVVE